VLLSDTQGAPSRGVIAACREPAPVIVDPKGRDFARTAASPC
jgi:bifunctional ADP-heptose synthase (sugar kinase/adenylyltransferase)